ncbi:MAG TPA: substrate-binding domain-containing protein [Xanthobacteraceae bacterium]|nr:substrate-binding domain-containing protein [Xanthobacteraceae bacterium]
MNDGSFARVAPLSAAVAFAFFLGVASYGVVADAAEIKILASAALNGVLTELTPQFERETGHKLAIDYGASATLKKRIEAGETPDVAILTPALIDDLGKQGKIAPGTPANISRTGVGVAVRAGAPKPDIGTLEAFKKALLAARSIGYTDPALGGLSGVYVGGMIERLGLAAELKPKTKLTSNAPHALAAAVANGDIELGLIQISEIVPEPSLELVGPLPPEVQNYSVFTAGVLASSKEPEAGTALVKFLRSPAALTVIKAKGMEPG